MKQVQFLLSPIICLLPSSYNAGSISATERVLLTTYSLLAALPMAARSNSSKERSTYRTDIMCEEKRLHAGTSFPFYSVSEATSEPTWICNIDVLEAY